MQNKGASIQLIKGTETRAFSELESARKDQHLVTGCMAKDLAVPRTPKRKVVSVNEQDQTAEIEILFSVKPSLVKPAGSVTSGWKLIS